jgi:hypothetical protein
MRFRWLGPVPQSLKPAVFLVQRSSNGRAVRPLLLLS